MSFMKFSKGKAIYSVPNGIGDGSAYFNKTEGVIANVDNLPYGNSARTISCWIYPTQYQGHNHVFFSYGSNNANQRYGIACNTSGSAIDIYGHGNTTNYSYNLAINNWYHVVITFAEDYTEQCYINGVLIDTKTHDNINTIKNQAKFGRSASDSGQTDWFYGNIKNLNVYNRVLSAEEVTQLYNKQEIADGLVLNVPLTYGKDNDSIFTSKNFVYDYSTLTTSSGFDEFGYPIRYDIASECGIAYSLLPTKGLIFYAPCETDINVEIGNQFTDNGSFTTQVADDIPCLKFSSPCRQEVDTSVFVKNQVTLSAWYYYTTSGDRVTILGYGYDNVYCAFCLQETNGQFTIERASGRFETGFYFESNKWYHLSVTLDNDSIKCYVNGELVNTFTYAMNVYSGNLAIGGWVGGGYSPNGYITKCRIYNRPLTDKEIKALAKEI